MRCISPISISNPETKKAADRLTVPCGRCEGCLYNRRADWAFRLKQEQKDCVNSYFLTLTYSDSTLPYSQNGFPSLRRKDLTDLYKRIRKKNSRYENKKFRYYSVGEYGENTGRPHYHIIAFNVAPAVIDNFDDYWKFGHHYVGNVEGASIWYCTKYHVNPRYRNLDEPIYDPGTGIIYDVQPEFCTMSRRPAIGHKYVKTHAKWHLENRIMYVLNDGYKQRMPRYYKEKIFGDGTFKRIIAEKQIREHDEKYKNEIKRLKRLGISKPERYLQNAIRQQTKKAYVHKKSDGIF